MRLSLPSLAQLSHTTEQGFGSGSEGRRISKETCSLGLPGSSLPSRGPAAALKPVSWGPAL